MVVNRFVSPDGTAASEQKWSYSLTAVGDINNSRVMTVTDPQLNSTVYSRAYGSPLPYQTDYKDSSGRVLRSVRGEVEAAPGTSQYVYNSAIFANARYKSLTTILSDTNQQSKTTFTYTAFNNVSEKDETDWGQGAPGSVIRKSTFSYLNDFNSAYAADGVHILDRAKDQSVCDGGSTFCSQSTTSYDTTAIASTANSPVAQHDYTNFPNTNTLRGNPTQISRVLNTGGNVVSTNTYNDVGNLITVTDPSSNVTTFSYADNFANGTPTQPTSAYVTQITRPVTNGVNHIQRSQYYFNTGLTSATCGENFPSDGTCAFGLTGTQPDYQNTTYDRMGRPLVVTKGDGGGTTLTYNEATLPINIGTSTKIDTNPAHNLTSTTTYDGLGRVSQTQLTSDPSGTTYQLTTYDSLGRTSQVFNPTRCNPPGTNCGEATWGYTSLAYDGLSRVTQTTSQDGGLLKTKFTGNTTLVTDQAGKQRQSITDALGRTVEVDEPGTQPPPQLNYAIMQTDGNFVLYNSSNSALWSTGTAGSNASSIFMQDDGNLVSYVFKWSAGVYAAGGPGPFPTSSCSIGTYLVAGQILPSGKCIVSPHGQYFLLMNTDGNFFIYDWAHGTGTWGPGTQGHPGAYAIFQTDGNLVVYDVNGTALWNSGTSGTYAERLNMEDDGRIIIYKSAWNSGTSTGQFNWSQLTHPSCDVGIGTGTTGVLGPGSCFVSPNGHFELLLQTDGNLVIYDLAATPPNALWSTGTGITPLSPGYSFVTKYVYDGLSNLTCVEQHGDSPAGSHGDGTAGTGCSAPSSSDANSTWRVRRFAYDTLSRLTSSSNPESNTATTGTPPAFVRVNTTYTYDPNGNLLQKTSPLPNQGNTATQTISYCYDALNRITGKKYAAQTCPLTSPVASYSYDQASFNGLTISNGIGRRTGMTDQAGSEAWSYDPMGRPASDKRTIGSVNKTTSYLYNLLGSSTSITYPSGRTIAYTYDSAGHATSAADTPNSINYATLAAYSPSGALSSLKNGTNLTSAFYYNNRLQPCRIFVTTGTGSPVNCADPGTIGNIMDFTYNFNLSAANNGNAISIANNRDSARNQSFAYDLLNRIGSAQTSATTGSKCFGESIGYDAWGNLLTIGGLTGYSGCTQENLGVGSNVKNQISTNAYDAAGNMTTGGYTYDAENHLLIAGGVTYTYDGDGKRVKKSSGTLYWYGMGADAIDETDLTGSASNSTFNEYVFFNGKRVARRNSSNTAFYYFADHLGTSRVMVQSGQTSACYDADFYPFGGERAPITNSCPQNYKFTGKERDIESGLDDFGARYYSNGLGRFITPDEPGADQHRMEPQSWNLYTYGRNNPLVYIDPTGDYVCGSSMSQAQCESFGESLANAQKSADNLKQQHGADSTQYKDAQRAIDAYGKANVNNGVTIQAGGDKDSSTTRTSNILGAKTVDNPTGQKQTVTFGAAALKDEGLVGHEGSHVADGTDWIRSGFSPALNPTNYATEVRAYMVQSFIYAGSGAPWAVVGGNNNQQYFILPAADLPNGRHSSAGVRFAVNQYLRVPKNQGGYGLTWQDKTRSFPQPKKPQ
jgi:RHS repeat-associated protein